MKINIKGFITSKKSELYSDCADNYAINIEHNKFSISDGVSKSFFPKIWSDILVNKYVNQKVWKDNNEFIVESQKEWQSKIDEIVNHPETKWFTKSQYNRKDPALATFVGLQFLESDQKWIAHALGDSFLFFIPKSSTEIETQLSSKSEPIVFDNFPDYFSSITIHPQKGKVKIKERPIIEGTFYLMTDALAEWFIKDTEQAVQKLKNIQNQEQFIVTIEDERNTNRLNDDDCAILIIEVMDDNKKEFTYSELEITYLSELIKQQEEEIEETKKKETSSQNSEDINSEETKKEEQEAMEESSESTTDEEIERLSENTQTDEENIDNKNEEKTTFNESENLNKETTNDSKNVTDEKQEEKLPEQASNVISDNPKAKSIFDKF